MVERVLISFEDLEKIANVLRIVGHPIRAFILHDLLTMGEPRCVSQIVEAVGSAPQPIISQQLRILYDAGLVERVREGNRVFYRVAGTITPVLSFLSELAFRGLY